MVWVGVLIAVIIFLILVVFISLNIAIEKVVLILNGKNNLNAFERLLFKPVKQYALSQQEFLSEIFKEIDLAYNKILSVAYDIEESANKNEQHSQMVFSTTKEIQNSISIWLKNLNLMLNQIEQVYQNTQELDEFIGTFKEKNANVQERVQQTLNQITDDLERILKENSDYTMKMSEYIEQLRNIFKNISNFLKDITKISEQINILALNASIETAKLENVLGENNLKTGFHVVADEIRRLASTTKSTVDEIGSFLMGAEMRLDDVFNLSAKSKDVISKEFSYNKAVAEKLAQISQSMEYTNSKINQAFEKLSIQFVIINDLNNYMTKIAQDYKNLDASAIRILSAVEMQKKTASRLNRLMTKLVSMCTEFDIVRNDISSKITKRIEIEINQEKIKEVLQAIENDLIMGLSDNWSNESYHKLIIDEYLKKNSNALEAIWTNELDGSFVYSNPPEGIENAKVREWFIKAAEGRTYVSEPYISAITKNYCITISWPVYSQSGKLLGVLGADIRL